MKLTRIQQLYATLKKDEGHKVAMEIVGEELRIQRLQDIGILERVMLALETSEKLNITDMVPVN